jgi:hypothetical protein
MCHADFRIFYLEVRGVPPLACACGRIVYRFALIALTSDKLFTGVLLTGGRRRAQNVGPCTLMSLLKRVYCDGVVAAAGGACMASQTSKSPLLSTRS